MLSKLTIDDISDATDAVTTELILMDYDWLDYSFNATIYTKNKGVINMKIGYNGINECSIYIKHHNTNDVTYYYEEYLDIPNMVADFIIKYEIAHAESLRDNKAFDNAQITINLYNKIIPLLTKTPAVDPINTKKNI